MERPEKIWQQIWEKQREHQLPLGYPASETEEISLTLLRRALGVSVRGKTCLETGSGTGGISIRLAKRGARSILLDVSLDAIMISKERARQAHVDVDLVVGSILALPFRKCCVDTVWSDGVWEHFNPSQQQAILTESLRVLRPKGKLVVIVPHKRAWFYNLFKVISMRAKFWPFGYEEPLGKEDFERFCPKPATFFSNALFWQFRCIYLPVALTFANVIYQAASLVLGKTFKTIDRTYSGYNLAAVWSKE